MHVSMMLCFLRMDRRTNEQADSRSLIITNDKDHFITRKEEQCVSKDDKESWFIMLEDCMTCLLQLFHISFCLWFPLNFCDLSLFIIQL